jgi:DNA protecting protein DprA
MTLKQSRTCSILWFIQCHLTAGEFGRFIRGLPSHAVFKKIAFEHPDQLLSQAYDCLTSERQKDLRLDFETLDRFQLSIAEQSLLTRFDIEELTQKELPADFPLVVRYSGEISILKKRRVAIVGSRHPTFYGREQAARFARCLAEQGVCIISGAAIGIDTVANVMAHTHGASLAVLGSGLSCPYPRSNVPLFQSLSRSGRGLLLSEFEDQQRAEKWNFPRRNRIIAALCDFLLVVEAGLGSGTMITAQLAADAGTDVGALPGPVHSPTSQGSHQLIKSGAFCIECPEEILERFIKLSHQTRDSREIETHDHATESDASDSVSSSADSSTSSSVL